MAKRSKRKAVVRLTKEAIDACLRDAARTVKEVERQYAGSFRIPAAAAFLRIG